MTKRNVRRLVGILLIIVTIALFIRFFATHPDYWQQLKNISPWWIGAVIVLNIPMVLILVFIYDACIRLCGTRIPKKENFLLTAYSSIANFFGPLQSGPGVRAVYLKARHKIRLRDFTLATLLYYGLFAFFSALFLLVGTRPWWQTFLALVAVAGVSWLVIGRVMKRNTQSAKSRFSLQGDVLGILVVFTFLQVILTAITYYVELRAVDPRIGVGQAISYAGAANFALFVSLTPDAIGIREAFLVFSQHIHHVSTGTILSANVIDRVGYLLFLGLLFLFVLGVHAKDKLRLTDAPPAAPKVLK